MLSATKVAISIKLAIAGGIFYMTLTLILQTFIWLDQLVFQLWGLLRVDVGKCPLNMLKENPTTHQCLLTSHHSLQPMFAYMLFDGRLFSLT